VFSSLGFYPVNPLDGKYYLGAPQFEKAEIILPSGKIFTVIAKNISEKNRYVKSKKLNGKTLDRPYITYEEIINGGVLEFEMEE
jgi:putative alpha-1,2-mannosidase